MSERGEVHNSIKA